jgi:hypothetical protein
VAQIFAGPAASANGVSTSEDAMKKVRGLDLAELPEELAAVLLVAPDTFEFQDVAF